MRTIRVGSRESRLAVIQSQLIMDAIRASHPEIRLELVTMKTTGDKILDRTLDQIGGKGLFVRELDAALLDGRVDLTVHSCKDLPMVTDPRLPLVAFSRREDPRDVLVLPEGQINEAAPIGCASARRRLQLAELFPGREVQPVRGNVQTRLAKLDSGSYSALVLAASGLKRLGLEHRISRYFQPEEMLPAAGQGILAVQGRMGENYDFLDCVNDADAALCARTERAFVAALGGGCSSPIAAYAVAEGDCLHLLGMTIDRAGRPLKGELSGPAANGTAIALALARTLKEKSL